MTRGAAALLALPSGGCASVTPSHPEAFAFGVMGDTPYNAREEPAFVAMLERIGREDLAFVVHVGDIAKGNGCSDALYLRRRAEFDASVHPLVFTPATTSGSTAAPATEYRDPVERLARLRKVFFADRPFARGTPDRLLAQDRCLEGAEGMPLPGHPENRWTRGACASSRSTSRGSRTAWPRSRRRRPGSAAATRPTPPGSNWRCARERSETRALVITSRQTRGTRGAAPTTRYCDRSRARPACRAPMLFVHGDTHGPARTALRGHARSPSTA